MVLRKYNHIIITLIISLFILNIYCQNDYEHIIKRYCKDPTQYRAYKLDECYKHDYTHIFKCEDGKPILYNFDADCDEMNPERIELTTECNDINSYECGNVDLNDDKFIFKYRCMNEDCNNYFYIDAYEPFECMNMYDERGFKKYIVAGEYIKVENYDDDSCEFIENGSSIREYGIIYVDDSGVPEKFLYKIRSESYKYIYMISNDNIYDSIISNGTCFYNSKTVLYKYNNILLSLFYNDCNGCDCYDYSISIEYDHNRIGYDKIPIFTDTNLLYIYFNESDCKEMSYEYIELIKDSIKCETHVIEEEFININETHFKINKYNECLEPIICYNCTDIENVFIERYDKCFTRNDENKYFRYKKNEFSYFDDIECDDFVCSSDGSIELKDILNGMYDKPY